MPRASSNIASHRKLRFDAMFYGNARAHPYKTNMTTFFPTSPASPYTVAVYPIQQEPGVWFPTYLIRRYAAGIERVVANVTMRASTHSTERDAIRAGIKAGAATIQKLRAA
ncbi:hypothetical protein [Cupriavidus plantarum]|uniref:hypothetical protein n=1 Tax=Cupriavidus plantarum TaxID=942865 RepID=UPI0039EFB787